VLLQVLRKGQPVVVPTVDGDTLPSVVAFQDNGGVLVGKAAKRCAAPQPGLLDQSQRHYVQVVWLCGRHRRPGASGLSLELTASSQSKLLILLLHRARQSVPCLLDKSRHARPVC
jgi:hypothetical protein